MTEEAAQAVPEQDARPVRMCDVCGGVDDHPRHVFAHAPGDGETDNEVAAKALAAVSPDHAAGIIAQIRDNTTTMRHMDCCREAGCPDGSCNQVTAGAEDKRGADLVQHLTSQQPSAPVGDVEANPGGPGDAEDATDVPTQNGTVK